MRGPHRTHGLIRAASVLALVCLIGTACGEEPREVGFVEVPGTAGRLKSSPAVRRARRAFDGAPPVIPHGPRSGSCLECHDADGLEVDGMGFAPAMPHALTEGLSAVSRCVQCHVYRATEEVFVASELVPYRAAGPAHRAHGEAPPVVPHPVFMRESCNSCHSGPAAREEIRTDHPERANCTQCHVPSSGPDEFAR